MQNKTGKYGERQKLLKESSCKCNEKKQHRILKVMKQKRREIERRNVSKENEERRLGRKRVNSKKRKINLGEKR